MSCSSIGCGFGSSKKYRKSSKKQRKSRKCRKSSKKQRKSRKCRKSSKKQRKSRRRKNFGMNTQPLDEDSPYFSPSSYTSPVAETKPKHKRSTRRVIPARRVNGMVVSPRRVTNFARLSPTPYGPKRIRRE